MMDIISVPLSPPYGVDDLFPSLASPVRQLDTSTILQEVPSQAGKLDHLPNIVVDDDPDIEMLKISYKEQNRSQVSLSSGSNFKIDENEMPISPSSSETSSTHEMVLVVADGKGHEREYRGPNRNAIMARLNRERKKKQLSHLEGTVNNLIDENKDLKRDRIKLQDRVINLEAEVDYLNGVLANQSELSGLLNNIKATSLSFHSSIPSPSSGNKRSGQASNNALTTTKKPRLHKVKSIKIKSPVCLETIRSRSARSSGKDAVCRRSALYEESLRDKESTFQDTTPPEVKGVCLHVKNKMVSLEFCASCSMRAEAAFKHDNEDSP